jgi:hypothetical protein
MKAPSTGSGLLAASPARGHNFAPRPRLTSISIRVSVGVVPRLVWVRHDRDPRSSQDINIIIVNIVIMFEHKPGPATVGPINTRTAAAFACLIAATALDGCAGDSPIVDNLLIVPGYYDTLTCPELIGQVQSAAARVKELTLLMEKSSGNAAGPVVNAMAYDTDYAKARATRKYSEEAAQRKGCDLTKKVEQKPTDHAPPLPAKPAGFGLPAMGSTGR